MAEDTMPPCLFCGEKNAGNFGSGKYCSATCGTAAGERDKVVEVKTLCQQPVAGYEYDAVVVGAPDGEVVTWWRRLPTVCCAACGGELGETSLVSAPLSSSARLRSFGYLCSSECLKDAWPQIRELMEWEATSTCTAAKPDYGDIPLGFEDNDQSMWEGPLPAVEYSSGSTVGLQGTRYVPSEADVGYLLRVQTSGGAISEATKRVLPPSAAAPGRSLTKLVEHKEDDPLRFSLMTYNCLAEVYCNKKMYPYCDEGHVAWNFRKKNLLAEIVEMSPDIACLQEVQADHFNEWWEPQMEAHGYSSLYTMKNRVAMGAAGKMDGCAMFWKSAKFTKVESQVLDFDGCAREMYHKGELGDVDADPDGSMGSLRRLIRGNVAQVVRMRLKDPGAYGREVHVSNTHFVSDEKYADVKLAQAQALLTNLRRISEGWMGGGSIGGAAGKLPLCVTGDFNSLPVSAVFALLRHGRVRPDEMMSNNVHTGERLPFPEDAVPFPRLGHTLDLVNVNDELNVYDPGADESTFTNFTQGFIGTLDYLWYAQNEIEVLEKLELHPKSEYQRRIALPNAQYSSDHVSLFATFRLKEASWK